MVNAWTEKIILHISKYPADFYVQSFPCLRQGPLPFNHSMWSLIL